MPQSILEKKLVSFYRNVKVERDGDIAIVTISRPEVKNALNDPTMNEIESAFKKLDADDEREGRGSHELRRFPRGC